MIRPLVLILGCQSQQWPPGNNPQSEGSQAHKRHVHLLAISQNHALYSILFGADTCNLRALTLQVSDTVAPGQQNHKAKLDARARQRDRTVITFRVGPACRNQSSTRRTSLLRNSGRRYMTTRSLVPGARSLEAPARISATTSTCLHKSVFMRVSRWCRNACSRSKTGKSIENLS